MTFALIGWALTTLGFVYVVLRLTTDARAERTDLLLRIQAPERVIERDLAPAGPDLPAIPFENDGDYWKHRDTAAQT